jgi:subtilisin family serine protease
MEAQTLTRLRVFLPILSIALVLLMSCSSYAPSTPDRDVSLQVDKGGISSAEVQLAVEELISNEQALPDQISMKFVEGVDIDSIVEEFDLNLIDYKEFIDFYQFALPEGTNLASLVATLRGNPAVEVAEPIYVTHMAALRVDPNDPHFQAGEQWYLENLDVPEAWVIEPGDPAIDPVPIVSDVAVAVLDTGFDYDHPDLNIDDMTPVNEKIFAGRDFVNGDSAPNDDNGHGTAVTGIIGARTGNATGISSIAWNPRIIPVKVLDQNGLGNSAQTTDGIMFAIQEFLENKDKLDPYDLEGFLFTNPFNARLIINMSFTYETPNALGPSQMELNAIKYAVQRGALMVAAAGDSARPLDDGSTSIYPASHSAVVAVGSTNQANALSLSSNSLPTYADPATSSFFVAPGEGIVSTYPMQYSDGYAVGSGSSFSAAVLSGVAALIWSENPQITPAQVIETLKEGADADLIGGLGPDHISGHGLINALKSLERNFTPLPEDEPMILRAFTNPILHGDIIFVVRSQYKLIPATEPAPPEDPTDPLSPQINNGMPISYIIGWDYDFDMVVDDPFPFQAFLDKGYWRHEIYIGELDDATYVGRIHFPQDLTTVLTPDPYRMGQLVITFTGVPSDRKIDTNLPQTISASTAIQIDEFNYDLPN